MEEGKALKKQIERAQDELAPDQVSFVQPQRDLGQTAPRAPDVVDEQFPTDKLQVPRSEADQLWSTKLSSQAASEAAGKPGVTQFGVLEARDEDFKRLLDRQALAEEANFQAWFAREFDKMSPAQKKRAKELFPQYYSQRQQLLRKQADNLFTFARLKLNGVEDFHDLKTQYMAETGRLDIGPLNHLLNPERDPLNRDAAYQQKKFVRGMWNPWRIFGDETVAPPDVATEFGVRKAGAKGFEDRQIPDDTLQRGYGNVGFPPTRDPNPAQGYNTWWRVLQNNIAPAPAAAGGGAQ